MARAEAVGKDGFGPTRRGSRECSFEDEREALRKKAAATLRGPWQLGHSLGHSQGSVHSSDYVWNCFILALRNIRGPELVCDLSLNTALLIK